MALQKQVVTIPFAKGMNEKSSDIHLEQGDLEVLENGVFDKLGEITKRNGYDKATFAITDKGKLEGAFPFRESVYLAYSESSLYRLGNALSSTKFGAQKHVGYYSSFSTEVFPASAGNSLHHEEAPSIATYGDYICIAYLKVDYDYTNMAKNYSHVVTLIEKEGMTVVSTTEARTGSAAQYIYPGKIKVVNMGTHTGVHGGFAVYYEYKNSSAYELRRSHLAIGVSSVTMPTLAGSGVVIAGSTNDYNQTTAQQWFDVAENGTQPVVAYYRNDSGTHSVRYVADSDPDGSFSGAYTTDFSDGLGGTAPATRLAIGSSSIGAAKYYVAWRTGTTVKIRIVNLDPSGASSVLSFTNSLSYFQPHGFVDHVPIYDSSINSVAIMFEQGANANTTTQAIYRITDPSGSPAISSLLSLGRGRASVQGFQFQNGADSVKTTVFGGSNAYDTDTELSTVSYHLDTNNGSGSLVGRSIVQAYRPEYSPFGPCRFVDNGTASTTEFFTAVPKTTNINTFPTSTSAVEAVPNSSIQIIKVTTDMPSYGVRHSAVGDNIFFTFGNAIYQDDGGNIVSIAGLPKPKITSVAASGTAGNMTTSKTYKYKIVFEREDINGNLYRSEPSDSVSVAMSSNTSTVITFEQVGMMVKHDDYYVAIYRTQADGSLYNRVATITGQSSYAGSTSTYADTFADSVVAAGAAIYTDTNELADVIVPACFYVKEHRNRIFGITEDNRIIFSKEYASGFGVSFSDSFYVPLDGSLDDKPTALGSAGGDLYIFRESSIYAISGDGPSKTGVGSYFTPRLVSNTIGAVKGSPTIYTDSGLYFQSINGIHRIGQNGIEYVGGNVEDTLGTSLLTVRDGALPIGSLPSTSIIKDIIEDQYTKTIRFLLSSKVLAFNTEFGQWSHYTYSTIGDNTFSGSASINNTVYLMTSDNELWSEDKGQSHLEAATYMPLKLKTGWISLNDVQGFSRAYRFAILGKLIDDDEFTMKVRVYYDYFDGAPLDTYTLDVDPGSDTKFQFRGHITKQKCQAIKFEIYDEAHADTLYTGKTGFSISSLAIEFGAKKGIYRMAESSVAFDLNAPSTVTGVETYVANLTRSIGGS